MTGPDEGRATFVSTPIPGQKIRIPPERTRKKPPPPPTTWAEDITKESVHWAVPDYIARRVVSSVYGPRNVGKTLLAIWLAASAASATAPLRVWCNSLEDDLPTVLAPRFDVAGIPKRQIRLTAEHWRLPTDLSKIRDGLREHRDGKPRTMY
jgi:hypothetical protein